jgi:hypothetical protein
MKISIQIDASPEEVRQCFGWPPMQPFHEELMRIVRENMKKGVPGFDPMTLMQAFIPTRFPGAEMIQKAFFDALKPGAAIGHERGTGPGSEVVTPEARVAVRRETQGAPSGWRHSSPTGSFRPLALHHRRGHGKRSCPARARRGRPGRGTPAAHACDDRTCLPDRRRADRGRSAELLPRRLYPHGVPHRRLLDTMPATRRTEHRSDEQKRQGGVRSRPSTMRRWTGGSPRAHDRGPSRRVARHVEILRAAARVTGGTQRTRSSLEPVWRPERRSKGGHDHETGYRTGYEMTINRQRPSNGAACRPQ